MRRDYRKQRIIVPTPIAWYDGIDNQNTGVHSSSATTWVDKMGTGWNFTNNINNGYSSWGGNYLRTGDTDLIPYNKKEFWKLGTGDFTYEVLVNIISGTSSSRPYLLGIGAYSGSGYNKNHIQYSVARTELAFVVNVNGTWYSKAKFIKDITDKNLLISVARINGFIYLYINGVLKSSEAYAASITVNYPMPYFGSRCCMTYCGKVYNVGLTAEEVAAECDWAENYYGITLDTI